MVYRYRHSLVNIQSRAQNCVYLAEHGLNLISVTDQLINYIIRRTQIICEGKMQSSLIGKEEACVYSNNSTIKYSDHFNIIRNIHLIFVQISSWHNVSRAKLCAYFVFPQSTSMLRCLSSRGIWRHVRAAVTKSRTPLLHFQGQHEMQAVVGVARSDPDRDSTIRVGGLWLTPLHFLNVLNKYSQTSVHERLGSRTVRFTNIFSEHKASRMTYCVSSYEHASRQNVDKNKSHWTTL